MWSASPLQTECDEEHLTWLSLGWAQVKELSSEGFQSLWSRTLLLLLCCFKLDSLDILANAGNCEYDPELVDRKGGAGGRLLAD